MQEKQDLISIKPGKNKKLVFFKFKILNEVRCCSEGTYCSNLSKVCQIKGLIYK